MLAERDEDIITLMKNSDILMRALVARREAVHTLLVSTSRFSKEITLLVKQSRADLKPALRNLEGVVNLLIKNQSNLDESLRLMAPVLPGLRQHPRHRAVVRHLDLQPASGPGGRW